MTDPTLDAIRQRHISCDSSVGCPFGGIPGHKTKCLECLKEWPCDAITLLDRLAEAEKVVAAVNALTPSVPALRPLLKEWQDGR